jgi:uncharacterized protein
VHGWLFWFMDILRFYALWAVFLPLFVRTPLRRLLAIALSFAILLPAVLAGIVAMRGQVSEGPAYDALALAAFSTGAFSEVLAANWKYDWFYSLTISPWGYQLAVFGRLLLGLYAARAFNLASLEKHRGALRKVLLAGTIVGAIGNSVLAGHFLSEAEGFFLPFLRRLILESGYLGFTLAYASGLALLFMKARWRRLIEWLAPVGRMALTWYLLQTVFGIWFFYGFVPAGPKVIGRIGPAWLVVIWLVGFSIQVALARAWMRRFRFGPAEWLWRTLTYWQPQPLTAPGRVVG